jgi:hypothetical protein
MLLCSFLLGAFETVVTERKRLSASQARPAIGQARQIPIVPKNEKNNTVHQSPPRCGQETKAHTTSQPDSFVRTTIDDSSNDDEAEDARPRQRRRLEALATRGVWKHAMNWLLD